MSLHDEKLGKLQEPLIAQPASTIVSIQPSEFLGAPQTDIGGAVTMNAADSMATS